MAIGVKEVLGKCVEGYLEGKEMERKGSRGLSGAVLPTKDTEGK